MRVLVIDDSKPVRSILRVMLSELGFEVALATDGADAMRQLETLPRPDLITVNWQMPHMDGIEFLRAFRANRTFRGVPVIMVSSEEQPARIAQARAAGADAYLVKPLTATVLAETIRPLMARAPTVPSTDSATGSAPTTRSTKTPKIRVLIVDDSVTIRRTLTKVLEADSELAVSGAAADGRIALNCLAQSVPDVVLLDIEMPNMNGFETLRELRKDYPHLPVIMFSSLTERGAAATLDALMLGANDYVPKPAQVNSFEVAEQCIRDEVIPKIKQFGRPTTSKGAGGAGELQPLPAPRITTRETKIEVLVIGVSTGGPAALARLLPRFVSGCPVPIVIVQHMPPIFTRYLAERLAADGHIVVHEGKAGHLLRPGEVTIVPGGMHGVLSRVGGQLQLQLNSDPPENSCRPAADVLFRSAAATCGAGTLAVVLTGMGKDGVRGCEQIVAAGGRVLVQDEASSVVWGMPGQVAQAGLAHGVFSLDRLPDEIRRVVGRPAGATRPAKPNGL